MEIVGGALVLLGLLTRLAALRPVIDMIMAIVTTKVPILLGHAYWDLNLRDLDRYGFWEAAHDRGPTGRCCWARSSC